MRNEVVRLVEQIKKEIFDSYVSKGLVASGEFGRELNIIENGDSIKLTAPHYVVQMERGRKAGTFPPVSAIRQWIRDKNKNAGTNIPEEAAFAIAYVIKRDGIKVPNKHNSGGVVSDVLNPKRVERLIAEINDTVRITILNILKQ